MPTPFLKQGFLRLFGATRCDERQCFDETYYRSTYPDITPAIDAFRHYMTHGWREGRNPSAQFNTIYYIDRYLTDETVNPLSHYLASGSHSGNSPVPRSDEEFIALQRRRVQDFFDARYYMMQVSEFVPDALDHYLRKGWREAKSPHPTFDVSRYYSENFYAKAQGTNPLYHYAFRRWMLQTRPLASSVGAPSMTFEMPNPDEVRSVVAGAFDANFYLKTNKDVKDAGIDPLSHFLKYGWNERRNPNALFDCPYYLTSNPDVAEKRINPFYHYLNDGRREGRRANPIGKRLYPPMQAPAEEAWARLSAAVYTEHVDYVIILPVYKGYNETLATIYAVLAAPQKCRFALYVVNDGTPDPKLDRSLGRLAGRGLFSYARNEQNLGFVKSVNRALRLLPHKEVILLNADAQVFGDWLDRINAHVKRDASIATLTPLSNNATICSYPAFSQNNLVETECSAQDLDRLAAHCNAGRLSDIPTGVGFCFFMSRKSRDAVGLFDEAAFGRGYGEENDFCLRAAKAGFRNVLAEDIFVYHAGQISFAEFEATEYGPGQAALQRKHPDYSERLRQHLEADPTARARMRLDLMRLAKAATPQSMVFVTHALAGGIITHVRHMEERLRERGIHVVHIRVGVSDRWSIDIGMQDNDAPYCPNLQPIAFNQVKGLLQEFLCWLDPQGIHIHSLVGFDWVATTGFLELVRSSAIPYYFSLHDYSIVCHRNNLIMPSNRYCGLPDLDSCRACISQDRFYPEAVDPALRQETFYTFLKGAKAIFAPSEDIRERLLAHGVPFAIVVQPHADGLTKVPTLRPPQKPGIIDIVTLGAIGPHKGSRIILNLARDAKARALPIRFHVIGYSDIPKELIAAGVEETGRYNNEAQAITYLERIKPSCVFLPSIWPETFCFTLSLAFSLEIPPVVFDLGAQAARVRNADFGFVLPYALIDRPQALNHQLLRLQYRTPVFDKKRRQDISYDRLIEHYYGFAKKPEAPVAE